MHSYSIVQRGEETSMFGLHCYYLRQGGIKFATVSPSVCLSVCEQDYAKTTARIRFKFSQYVHIIHGSVPFENGDILSARLSVIEERKAHFGPYISMGCSTEMGCSSRKYLPSPLFSFTVTVFFSRRFNFGYSQEYMVWAKFYCSLISPQIRPKPSLVWVSLLL